jgi:hypothetical protein
MPFPLRAAPPSESPAAAYSTADAQWTPDETSAPDTRTVAWIVAFAVSALLFLLCAGLGLIVATYFTRG